MNSYEADLCHKRQLMSNEVEENLKLFFGRFLNMPEEMDVYFGFKGSH